jgi:hypothetical protein
MTSVEAIVRHFSGEAVVFAFHNGDDGEVRKNVSAFPRTLIYN